MAVATPTSPPSSGQSPSVALTSPRFAGNPRLQAAANNKPPLMIGEPQGPAVEILQQSLVDLGFQMPISFAKGAPDGIYGKETADVVRKFQIDQKFPPSGWDGRAGRDTLSRLDALFQNGGPVPSGSPPVPPSPASPTNNDALLISLALLNSRRTVLQTMSTLATLETTLAKAPAISVQVLRQNKQTFDALDRWLKVKPGNGNFLSTVRAARQLMFKNLSMGTRIDRQPQTGPDCSKGGFAWTNVGHPELGCRCCDAFFTCGPDCRRDVITHEFFHLVGLNDHPETKREVQPTAQALDDADTMAQLVADIVEGRFDACNGGR